MTGAEIIAGDGKKNGVSLGDVVTLKSDRQTVEYKVVGAVEADPLSGKISDESALGKQLIGKKVGDSATVKTPKGEKNYKILKIE